MTLRRATTGAVLASAGAALLLGAFLAGRSGGPAPRAPRAAERHACAHPPPEPAPRATPEEKTAAIDGLRELRDGLRRAASDRPARLDDLRAYLSANLAEGKISAEQIVAMFRAETDAGALDVLQGALASQPEAADGPGILDAFLAFAREDGDVSRRQAALAFLGSAWDRDGRVREAILALAARGHDETVRLSAIGTLPAFAAKNQDQAAAVNSGLLELARGEPEEGVRAQALEAVGTHGASEPVFLELARFLEDPAPGPRLAAAAKLGDAPPPLRAAALVALETRLALERDPAARQLLLQSLVKAGRTEAADPLRRAAARDPSLRPDAEEYLALLERGFVDWSDLLREKSALESARPR